MFLRWTHRRHFCWFRGRELLLRLYGNRSDGHRLCWGRRLNFRLTLDDLGGRCYQRLGFGRDGLGRQQGLGGRGCGLQPGREGHTFKLRQKHIK